MQTETFFMIKVNLVEQESNSTCNSNSNSGLLINRHLVTRK